MKSIQFLARFMTIVVLPFGAGTVLADGTACKAVLTAMTRVAQTPVHEYMTQTAVFTGSKPRHSEVVITAGTMYVLAGDKWRSTKYDAEESVGALRTRIANASGSNAANCARIGDEAVAGEAAARYTTHEKTEYGTVDNQFWISTSRGLPLRQVIDVSEGKSHTEVRFDYANVQPPASR